MQDSPISGLVITGLLAVLGTVVGGVIQGHWETELAHEDFQSKLIMRALESDHPEERVSSLKFLVNTQLINNADLRAGLQKVIDSGSDNIPHFHPTEYQVAAKPTALQGIVAKFPELKGKKLAVTGFHVGHGDIIDSITPVYAQLNASNELVGEYTGDLVGGRGGNMVTLSNHDHVVTGIDIHKGDYYGQQEIVALQVYWHRITADGRMPGSEITSDKLGTMTENSSLRKYRAANYVEDFVAESRPHTDGSTFLHSFTLSEAPVVLGN